MKNKVLVFGFGESLNSRQDIAVEVIAYLRNRNFNNLELLDSRCHDKNLNDCIESSEQLILIDADHVLNQRNAVCVYEGCEMDAFVKHRKNSDAHEQALRDALGLAELKGKLPRHRALVGIQLSMPGGNDAADVNLVIGRACHKVFEITQNWKV